MVAGAAIKRTLISSEFNYETFRTTYHNEVIPLFIVSGSGQGAIVTSDTKVAPSVGQSIIALVNLVDKTALEEGRYRTATPLKKTLN